MARLSSLFLLGPDQCGAEREFSQLIRKSLSANKRESSLKNNKPPMNRGPGRWRYNYIFYLCSSVDSGMLKSKREEEEEGVRVRLGERCLHLPMIKITIAHKDNQYPLYFVSGG